MRTEYYRTSFENDKESDEGAVSACRVTIDESVKFVTDEELLVRQQWVSPLSYQGKTQRERTLLAQQQRSERRWQLPFCILEVKIEKPQGADSGVNEGGAQTSSSSRGSSDERDAEPLIADSNGSSGVTAAAAPPTVPWVAEVPCWVEPLIQCGALRPAAKFSKYLTGCAQLLPESIDSIPSWMPALQRSASLPPASPSMELPAEGSPGPTVDAVWRRNTAAFPHLSGVQYAHIAEVTGGKRVIDRSYRCEPKTFMANERTYLSWMRSLLPIGAVGLGLLRMVRSAQRTSSAPLLPSCRPFTHPTHALRAQHYCSAPVLTPGLRALPAALNNASLQGFTTDGLVLVSFTVLGTLYAAHRYEHRYQLCVNRVSSVESHHDRRAIPVMTTFFCLAMGIGAYVHYGPEYGGGSLGTHIGLSGPAQAAHKALRGGG